MAKITRAVKGVAKATANKRAKKVVTTGRDSSARTIGNKALTYEGYLKKGKLNPQEAKTFKGICLKRPFVPKMSPWVDMDYEIAKGEIKSKSDNVNELEWECNRDLRDNNAKLEKAVQYGDAKSIADAANIVVGLRKVKALFK